MMDYKHIERGNHEEDQRIACQTIGQSPPARRGAVFRNRQGPDIAGASLVQITRGTMMQGMLPSPMPIRREIEQTGNGAGRIVGFSGIEEGGVPAVMENNEYPCQKAGGNHGERQHQPIGNCQRIDHGDPEQHIRKQRVHQLPSSACRGGFPKRRHQVFRHGAVMK